MSKVDVKRCCSCSSVVVVSLIDLFVTCSKASLPSPSNSASPWAKGHLWPRGHPQLAGAPGGASRVARASSQSEQSLRRGEGGIAVLVRWVNR